MNRRKVESKRERRILIGIITSKVILGHARKVLPADLFEAEHFKIVTEWCYAHYDQYGEPPRKHVEDLYHAWSENNDNTELVDAVKDFLESLSGEYDADEELNVGVMLDHLKQFVDKRTLMKLKDSIEYAITHNEIDDAKRNVQDFRSAEVGQGSGFDPMLDKESWDEAFAESTKPLISFDGDAGDFFHAALVRDSLVGIQAPEKTGKTFLCTELVFRALQERRRVGYFQVGDLSKPQVMRRLGVRWSGHPSKRKYCGRIKIPCDIELDDEADSGYKVKYTKIRVDQPMNKWMVKQGIKQFRKAHGLKPDKSYIQTSVHSTCSINVRGISEIIDQWETEKDFIPDIIVIDYADILAPEDPKKDTRHQINETWQALRKLSQDRHALVIVPTQANAASYSAEPTLQTRKNYSEDKRKLAHVTALLAMNQTPDEEEMQTMRLNWVVLREGPAHANRPLHVGTCFALGKAICCAKF